MHYPTHSIGGLMSVMDTHATEVAAVGFVYPDDDWFNAGNLFHNVFSNETALCKLANGATARICEFRRVGHVGREGFQIYGTEATFQSNVTASWWISDKEETKIARLSIDEMRDPLPEEVLAAFIAGCDDEKNVLGGHGGSHAYLVHEFVDAVAGDRTPAINAWQAARYLAPGAVAHKSALADGEWMKVPDWGDGPD